MSTGQGEGEGCGRGGQSQKKEPRYRWFPRWERTCLKDFSTGETRFGSHFGRLYLLISENGLQRARVGQITPGWRGSRTWVAGTVGGAPNWDSVLCPGF